MKELLNLRVYFKKYRYHLFGGFLFILLTNYFRILSPQITGYVINSVVGKISGNNQVHKNELSNYDILVQKILRWFDLHTFNQKVLYAGLLLLAVALLSGFFMFLMRQTIIVMSRLIEFDQKNDIYRHYQKLDLGFFKRNQTGDLMNRISEDVSRVRMYTGPAIMYFINLAGVIGFSVFFMWKADPKLTLVALSPMPLLAITIYFVNTIINRKSENIQRSLSMLTSNAQESYSGIRVIKSFVQERSMESFFRVNSNTYKTNALSLAKTEALYFPSIAFLIGLSTLITVMVGAIDVVNGISSMGKIAEFVLYIQMMTFPVSAIGWTASSTQRAIASQRRIDEFLLTKPAVESPVNGTRVNVNGNISLKNVSFTYPDTGIEALKNISINIRQGEKIAIIGKTGSGKSTLAQLLMRLYDPQSGEVLVENENLKTLELHQYRDQLAYVPQEVFLFSDTIANNIRFGKRNASPEEVHAAAEIAGIRNEILAFEKGFDTMVGERGVTLSGGQKQRISIARALIKEPRLLIFDDCLSAVDATTEQRIVASLNNYLVEKTAIIITHRIFSSFNFDRIIVMDGGGILEEGTHDELLQKGGYYANLLASQNE